MPEKRSLFERIFGSRTQPNQVQSLRMMNQYVPTFTTITDAYDSDVVRSAVDAIARNGAKLKARHVRRIDGQIQDMKNSNIEYLLSTRPNPYMDAYTFLYKTITALYMQNNAFVFVDWEPNGEPRAFYPITANQVEFVENTGGGIFCSFKFMQGQQITLPYDDIIHLRRFFYRNDLYGENGQRAILPTIELINTTNEGIVNAVKSSATLRGLLKFTSMLKPEDMKKQRDAFVADYLDITNNGGVAATDSKADYVPLTNDPKIIDSKQMEIIEDKIYKYYNVNESIVKSEYTEEQWSAFYESVIEPIAVQLSLEFTAKLFTRNEQRRGNEIMFESNRLQYASNATKISITETLMDRGILSKNEAREIFNMPPIDGGDQYIVSLNYVNAQIADIYQLGRYKLQDQTQPQNQQQQQNQQTGGKQDANNNIDGTVPDPEGSRVSPDDPIRTEPDGDE